jgi:A/G-specific adenine glycosylase
VARKSHSRSNGQPEQFRSRLLDWYDVHARDLPWRERPGYGKHRDAYRVWVSEIMLQQTRVAAVIEHYHEFLRRFPTVQKLASARESSVLAAWSGLGYYRRARMMHAAAEVIARERHGKLPTTAREWLELPGIGRYTSAAIASIAFGEPVAVVDGNVERVIRRITGQCMSSRMSEKDIWQTAEDWLDRDRPGDFNQAMMELGATVCTPRAPVCLTCPVMQLCATRGELAGSDKPARQKKREIHYALHHRSENGFGGEVFLVQRPREASLMAGMWELPEIPPPADRAKPAFTVRHSITVTDYTVRVWRVDAAQSSGQWIATDRLRNAAITGLARKILREAEILKPRRLPSEI